MTMTNTHRLLRRQWNAAIECSDPDPTLIGELYLAMRREEKISAAYSASMEQSIHDDPTGQDLESLEAFGMTVDECFEQGEDERRAERANEYALEGVTNYEEGSYLEEARDEARAWSALGAFDKNEPY